MTENCDPAAARKRRKEIMQSLRAENVKKEAEAAASLAGTEALPPKKRKVNTKAVASTMETKETDAASIDDPTIEDVDRDDCYDSSGCDNPTGSSGDNKKMQIRYDPEVPMSKEQLAAWRREARRVRNRESAAASRQRIRDRINELEIERDEWKTRFIQATNRLAQLERLARGGDGGSSTNGDE